MTSIPNCTKNIPKKSGTEQIRSRPHCLKHCVSGMLCIHYQAPNNMKNFSNYSAHADFNCTKFLLKTILELNESPTRTFAACRSINVHTAIYIQPNLAIPTPGFHVTPLITSVLQNLDFLYMILI